MRKEDSEDEHGVVRSMQLHIKSKQTNQDMIQIYKQQKGPDDIR